MKILTLGLVAGALLFSSPVMVSSPAVAQDTPAATGCADPASPQNRPGGFCQQSDGTKSLSDPGSDVITCKPLPADFMLPEDFFETKGARVTMAVQYLYDADGCPYLPN
jgi:hypothetical protein